MPDLSWRPILVGAGCALAVALPVSVLSGVVDSAGSTDDDSSLVFAFLLVVLLAVGVGGALAARDRPDAPLTHGAVAGFVAFVPVQVLGAASQAVNSDTSSLSIFGVVFAAMLLTSAGMLGAGFSQRRRR